MQTIHKGESHNNKHYGKTIQWQKLPRYSNKTELIAEKVIKFILLDDQPLSVVEVTGLLAESNIWSLVLRYLPSFHVSFMSAVFYVCSKRGINPSLIVSTISQTNEPTVIMSLWP